MKILLKYLMLIALLLGVVSCDWGNIDNECRDDAEYYFGNLSYGDTPVDTLPGDRFGYDLLPNFLPGNATSDGARQRGVILNLVCCIQFPHNLQSR